MDPTRTQRYGKHYYRNNYVPSSSRQVLEDRLHPPGISTSSNSSWTFSNSHDIPKHKKGRICGIFLIGAVMFVALAVIAIGGLAFYIGGHSTDAEQNVRKYQTKDNIGAKRQYSNRETERTKITNSQYSPKVAATTQGLLETSTEEPNQTKSVSAGAILGLSDTMKLLNSEVKSKKKDEGTTVAETLSEIAESLTEVIYSTEESGVPYLTTRDVEILPKNSEKSSVVVEENLSEDKKLIGIADGSTKTETIQNGHARPTFSGPLLSPIATTMSAGLFPPHRDYADEPWRPIIPSYREPVRIENPHEQFSEKVFQHRYGPTEEYIIDNDSPITFSRKSYEQNLGISSEFKGIGNKLKKTQSSRISDELAVKYKDLITKEGLEASGGIPEVVVRSGDIVPSPPRKSADVIILGELSTASTLSALYNAKKIIKTNEDGPQEEEYTFKVPHSIQGYGVTEPSSEASSPDTTTTQTKITPVTFKTILHVTSKKPDEKNSTTAVSGVLYEQETAPIKNEAESAARKETVTTERLKTTTRSQALTNAEKLATERLKTTTKSDILTIVEASLNSTTEVTSTAAAVNLHYNKKIIKNPFADDSRSSSSSFNFGIPDLPILKQFQNLDTFLKTAGNGSVEKNTTDMSKYFVRNDENPDQIITRFPVRTRATTPKSYKRDDPSPAEIITTETIPKSIPVYQKPVVIRGEVEVVSGSLKQGITGVTTEIPKLITLLPVRSNVNMMKPLRPRPKSNISSTIVVTDRKAKMNSQFSAKESAIGQTVTPKLYYSVPFQDTLTKGNSQWVYHSSSDSRDIPNKDEKLFVVTPEPKNSENTNSSTEEAFSHFPENLAGLPLYNTIEALLNVDNRDRGANRNNNASGGKTRESLKEPTKKNTSEIVNQIVKVVDSVVISSGDLPKIIVKVNQTMVNKTTSE